MENQKPGWYDDPEGSDGERWWDGKKWGNTVLPKLATSKPVNFPIPVETPVIPAPEDLSPAESAANPVEPPSEDLDQVEHEELIYSGLDAENIKSSEQFSSKKTLTLMLAILAAIVVGTAFVSFFINAGEKNNEAKKNIKTHVSYNKIIKTNFIKSCLASAHRGIDTKVARSLCECSYRDLKAVHSFEDFVKLDRLAAKGHGELTADESKMLKKAQTAASQCVLKTSRS